MIIKYSHKNDLQCFHEMFHVCFNLTAKGTLYTDVIAWMYKY